MMSSPKKAHGLALFLPDRGIQSLFLAGIRASHENIEKTVEPGISCREIGDHSLSLPQEIAVAPPDITESTHRAREYSGDISENVINSPVEEAG